MTRDTIRGRVIRSTIGYSIRDDNKDELSTPLSLNLLQWIDFSLSRL